MVHFINKSYFHVTKFCGNLYIITIIISIYFLQNQKKEIENMKDLHSLLQGYILYRKVQIDIARIVFVLFFSTFVSNLYVNQVEHKVVPQMLNECFYIACRFQVQSTVKIFVLYSFCIFKWEVKRRRYGRLFSLFSPLNMFFFVVGFCCQSIVL